MFCPWWGGGARGRAAHEVLDRVGGDQESSRRRRQASSRAAPGSALLAMDLSAMCDDAPRAKMRDGFLPPSQARDQVRKVFRSKL